MNFALDFGGGTAGAVLAAAAAAALVWSVRMSRGLPPVLRRLRAATMLLLALAFLKPSLAKLSAKEARPRLTVMVDTSFGMGAGDKTGKTRAARAAAWLLERRKELEARAEPVLYSASDRARRLSWEDLARLESSPAGLDLAAALRDAQGAGAPSRLWLFSDGSSEASEELDSALVRWGAPVDAAGVGPRRAARAVAVGELKLPDFVFLHSRFPVGMAVEASELAGGAVTARLWKGAALVDQVKLPVKGDFEVLSATLTAEAQVLGQERYRLELLGVPADGPGRGRTQAFREFGVEVIRQKYRIMYLAGRPSFEYSHLREQLKGDPNHELVSFVILRNPENASPFSDSELSLIPFPAQEIFVQNLFQFDLFILENFAYWRFNLPVAYLEGLKRFVAGGGALLVIGGTNAFTQGGYHGTALEDILPVSLWQNADDFSPGLFKPKVLSPGNPLLKLADTPESSMSLWEALPPLDGFNRFAGLRPQATALLAHPSEKLPSGGPMPLVALREYGQGKVMVVGTDSTWRWKLGGGMDWKISSFYARFWSRAVEYLTGSLDLKKVRFGPLPDRMPAREPAILTLHVFDESFRPLRGADLDLQALWTAPGGRTRSVAPLERSPGVFDVELTGLASGRHQVRAVARYRGQPWGEDLARFVWEAKPPEAPLNRKWLKGLADRAGGRYSDLDRLDVSAWLEELPPVKTEREELRRWPLWSSTAWLLALAASLLAEWALRRRMGYV